MLAKSTSNQRMFIRQQTAQHNIASISACFASAAAARLPAMATPFAIFPVKRGGRSAFARHCSTARFHRARTGGFCTAAAAPMKHRTAISCSAMAATRCGNTLIWKWSFTRYSQRRISSLVLSVASSHARRDPGRVARFCVPLTFGLQPVRDSVVRDHVQNRIIRDGMFLLELKEERRDGECGEDAHRKRNTISAQLSMTGVPLSGLC